MRGPSPRSLTLGVLVAASALLGCEVTRRRRAVDTAKVAEPASDEPVRPGRSLVDSFLFHPRRLSPEEARRADPTIEEVTFRTNDGLLLAGRFAEAPRPRAVVLYCEGNAGNIADRTSVIDLFRDRMRASVLRFDYRGYGRSEGSPSVGGILVDARAARRWLAARAGVLESEIILVGQSLGGAVAVDLAARDGARGLVLENTFSSLADVTEVHFGRVARLIAGGRLDSAALIRSYRGPLLQTHGDADTVVPHALGLRLFDAGPGPKRFIGVPAGGHNDPPSPAYLDALDVFLDAPGKVARP